MSHTYELDIRWGDMDAYGHVNNTLFFRYLESARFRYIEDHILPLLDNKMPVIVLADIQCKFEQQIVYPAHLTVKSRVTRLGNSSFDVTAEIYHGERRCAVSKAVLVWLDEQTGKPMKIPEAVALKITELDGPF